MSINDGGTPYQIATGCNAKLVGKQPNGDLFYHDCEIEDNRIVYTFNEVTACVLGVTYCEVRIYSPSGNLITAPRFYIVVEEKVLSDEEVDNIEPEDIAVSDMNYSKYRFTLDIHKSKSQVSIPVMLGDTSVKFYMSINDGGSPYQLAEGCTAKFAGKKPDGTIIFHDCEIEDNRIVYTFRPTTASVNGVTNCEVRIYGRTEGVLTTPRFFMAVEEKVLLDEEIEDYIESSSDLTGLDGIIITEQGRVAAEEERVIAEQGRVLSEAERSSAEAERANTETARAYAETARTEAEAERYDFYQSMLLAKANGEFNGEDGITPELRINSETNYWEVSYDKGETWASLGVKATAEKDEPGEGTSGGIAFTTDETLTLSETNVLSVNTVNEAKENESKPITSGAVYSELSTLCILLDNL
jgi:hypothetical protein